MWQFYSRGSAIELIRARERLLYLRTGPPPATATVTATQAATSPFFSRPTLTFSVVRYTPSGLFHRTALFLALSLVYSIGVRYTHRARTTVSRGNVATMTSLKCMTYTPVQMFQLALTTKGNAESRELLTLASVFVIKRIEYRLPEYATLNVYMQ